MKTPLRYQISDFDCGPTTLLNAISFLFEREQIPAALVRNIMLYSLDCYNNQGEEGKHGTSTMAMMFLSNWINQFAPTHNLSVSCHYLRGSQVKFGELSELNDALMRGGAVVARVWDEVEHYVLMTGLDGDMVQIFDPYYQLEPFKESEIKIVKGHSFAYNRVVPMEFFNAKTLSTYSLGVPEQREAVLIFNELTKLSPERTIDYFI